MLFRSRMDGISVKTVSKTRICRLALTLLASVAGGTSFVRSGRFAELSNGRAAAGVCAGALPAHSSTTSPAMVRRRPMNEHPCSDVARVSNARRVVCVTEFSVGQGADGSVYVIARSNGAASLRLQRPKFAQ